jgi:2-polyprenyl-3-methyl-5-hydroxy-6-metoxy-1,4-benzoquinol methylase
MNTCHLCRGSNIRIIYEIRDIPIFQNKIYLTAKEARNVLTGDIVLGQCQACGFVFNRGFDDKVMNYDSSYENEQAYSDYFQLYVREIIELLRSTGYLSNRIIEIGCGKGYFLNQLEREGFDVIGFDPAYDGDNPRIIKDYFGDKYKEIRADTLILRHTLEHIQMPFDFIHSIAKSNGYTGKIFVEVPCFDWIIEKSAFWDIYYEHCNYFTIKTLRSMFTASITGKHFRDQYIHLLGDLNDLKSFIKPDESPNLVENILFAPELERYKRFVMENQAVFVWGAGAKGATFVNLTDSHRRFIDGLIDINPKKQNRYIAKTGHKIYGINVFEDKEVKNILVMNENYFSEIKNMVSKPGVKLSTLGVFHGS